MAVFDREELRLFSPILLMMYPCEFTYLRVWLAVVVDQSEWAQDAATCMRSFLIRLRLYEGRTGLPNYVLGH